MVYITPPEMNDSFSRIVLDGVEYLIRFTYDSGGDFWTFGLYRAEEDPIITAIKIVPCFPLNHYFKRRDMPDGIFGVLTKLSRVGHDAFSSGDAQFVYITDSEITQEAKQYE